MHNDDDYENMTREEFNERLKVKGNLLLAILDKAHEVGGGLELIISVMAQKFTPEELKDVYISLDEYGREIVDYGDTMRELNHVKEDDDESNRN